MTLSTPPWTRKFVLLEHSSVYERSTAADMREEYRMYVRTHGQLLCSFGFAGAAYCTPHYRDLMGEACFVCQKRVKGKDAYTDLLNKDWCAAHLRCFGCDQVRS